MQWKIKLRAKPKFNHPKLNFIVAILKFASAKLNTAVANLNAAVANLNYVVYRIKYCTGQHDFYTCPIESCSRPIKVSL